MKENRLALILGIVFILLIISQFWIGRPDPAVVGETPGAAANGSYDGSVGTLTSAQETAISPLNSSSMQSEILGVPAISPTILDAPANSPAFTEADVLAYFEPMFARPDGSFGGDTVTTLGARSVAAVDFVTAEELSASSAGFDVPVDADRLLCVVQLKGSFSAMYTIPHMPEPRPTIEILPFELEVYDARTGNMLMFGAIRELVGFDGP